MAALAPIQVINLARTPERLARFGAVNAHLAAWERFEAVDGGALDRAALIAAGDMAEDCPYGPGTLGCALSHVALWRKAVAEDRPITVMEDDVLVSLEFEAQAAALTATLAPGWELLLWGYAYGPKCPLWIDLGVSKVALNPFENRVFAEPGEFQAARCGRAMVRLLNAFGLLAYTVAPRGAAMLLAACVPLTGAAVRFATGVTYVNRGIDGPTNLAYPEMRAFACLPPLAIHDTQETPHSVRRRLDGEL